MTVTQGKLWSIAETAAMVIDHQLSLTDETAWGAMHHIWVVGYCHGAFEAVAQHHKMDKVETYALITIAFNELLLDGSGEKRLGLSLRLQDNKLFLQGKAHGFDDFTRFVASTDFQPLSLTNFFVVGMPPPPDAPI